MKHISPESTSIKLTPREDQIMKYFWRGGAMPIRELLSYFPEPHPHVNTVSTIVRMLEEKGYVGHRQEGKGYVYFPIISPMEVGWSSVKGAIKRYFNNSYLGMVSALVKDEDVSIGELRRLLDEIESNRDSNPDKAD